MSVSRTNRIQHRVVTVVAISRQGRLQAITRNSDDNPTWASAATYYEYGELGNVLRTGQDADGTPGLALGSATDRITEAVTYYSQVG